MVTTDLMVALAFSELDVDLEREYPRTIARQTEHGWELSGKKNMVSNVTLAGLIFVLAQTIDLKGNRGMRIVIVDAKSQGVKIGQSVDKVGVRAMPLAPIEFENVLIGNDCLMSDSIEGRTQLQQILIKMRSAAAEGLELYVGDGVILNFQVDLHNIAALGVAHLTHAVGVRKDAHVSGVAEMVHNFFTV